MAVLLNHHEEALKDVNRQQVKAGATVVDVLFVDGIARGTNTIPQQNSNRRAMSTASYPPYRGIHTSYQAPG